MCRYFHQSCIKRNDAPWIINHYHSCSNRTYLGAEPLGGYMAGVCVSGVVWAIFQNNAGGAWDNAKKSIEAGVEINGEMVSKGSEAHMAAVTGDTVGDPFKDTSGPSMNILIKLTCLIGLVVAPILGSSNENGNTQTSGTSTVEAFMIDEDGEKVILTENQIQYIETSNANTASESRINKTITIVDINEKTSNLNSNPKTSEQTELPTNHKNNTIVN